MQTLTPGPQAVSEHLSFQEEALAALPAQVSLAVCSTVSKGETEGPSLTEPRRGPECSQAQGEAHRAASWWQPCHVHTQPLLLLVATNFQTQDATLTASGSPRGPRCCGIKCGWAWLQVTKETPAPSPQGRSEPPGPTDGAGLGAQGEKPCSAN